jgi:HD-GYP domain-containing protein (c-di-GMP phosphodiesterase class II)
MITVTSMIAQKFGMSDESISAVQLGALLHDVGKIGIRDSVLNKPNPFTPEERRDMERHPLIGADLVGSIHGLPSATLECIRHHHESWDGSGYPDGLAGEEIPLSARIVCVVDVWDAMQSSRPYKPSEDRESVVEYFEKHRGVRFDPEVVDIFLALLADDEDDLSSF